MGRKKTTSVFEKGYAQLAEAFSKIYLSVVEVDLDSGNAITLKSPDTEVVMKRMQWESLIARYAERRACPSDRAIILSEFSTSSLCSLLENGQRSKSMEVRCGASGNTYEWMELSAMIISSKEKKLLITTRNINEQRLLKSIAERFLYKNCDYFVLLDTKNNSFVRFMGNDNGSVLPPIISDDYTKVLKEYNQQFVMPNDVDRVTALMQIDNILKILENQDEYEFYCDGVPENGVTRRKRMQFVYHDKNKGLVLITRSDVTEIYLKEKEINDKLLEMITKAKTDSLTGLYNQATTADIISQKIINGDGSNSALLFIDVDNFKSVNDTLGHLSGDYLLKFVAKSLRAIVNDSAILGRIGGDEFLVYVEGDNVVDTCVLYANKICKMFADIEQKDTKKLNLTCSVGISVYPNDGINYETLIRKADQALYDSKRHGKSKYCFYSEATTNDFCASLISKIDGETK